MTPANRRSGSTPGHQRGTQRRSHRQRLVAIAILVVMVALLLSMLVTTVAGAAPGVAVTETGWWSRNPFAAPPANGFTVAAAPDGPASVSAVRVAVDGRVLQATLILNEAGGVPEAAALQVCTTVEAWSPADHAWASAPDADCGAAVAMQRNATSANWTADITALLQTDLPSVSLVVVPGSAPAPVWQVDFSAAIVSGEAEENERADPEPGAQPSGSGEIVSGAGGSDFGTPPPAVTGGGNAFAFGTPPAGLDAAPVGVEPSLEPGPAPDELSAEPTASALVEGFVPASDGNAQPWGRLAVFLPVSILAGAAVAYGRRRALARPLS